MASPLCKRSKISLDPSPTSLSSSSSPSLTPCLVELPDCPLDGILSYASDDLTDLGGLSLTCRRLRRSCDDFARKLFGEELQQQQQPRQSQSGWSGWSGWSRTGTCSSTPLDWSWPGRLSHLRTPGCLLVYGHCASVRYRHSFGQDYDDFITRFFRLFSRHADLTAKDREQVKYVSTGMYPDSSARLGGRNYDGYSFALLLDGMSRRARDILLDHLSSGGTHGTNGKRWSCGRPLVIGTREVLLVAPSATDADELRIPSYLLPPEERKGSGVGGEYNPATDGIVYTFRTKLRRTCWNCHCPIKDELVGACDECMFQDEEDDERLGDAMAEPSAKEVPFSSDPERARKMAKEEGKEDEYEVTVILEMLSSAEKDAAVLAVAEVHFSSDYKEFGIKAGPTLHSIKSDHDQHEAMLEYFMMWSEVIFPPPSELQVDSSALREIADGVGLLRRYGWADSNGEGDYVVMVGLSKA